MTVLYWIAIVWMLVTIIGSIYLGAKPRLKPWGLGSYVEIIVMGFLVVWLLSRSVVGS